MAKRGANDQHGNFSEANANAVEWEFAGLNIASAATSGNPALHADQSSHMDGGFDAFAAGGKKTSGSGGSTSTSGSTGTSGGGTTTGGSTGGGTTVTTADVYPTIPIAWKALNPPVGDSGTPTDSLYVKQWNLFNAKAGIDVLKTWENYTGKGVKIGIVDDGVDYNHSDIKPNYLFNLDYDAVTGGSDPFGDPTTEFHGTSVLGVIGAARDGSGTVGVAYNAGLADFRISYSAGSPGQLADALNHLVTNGMDVGNASWGYTTAFQDNFFSSAFSSSKAALLNDVANGRGGLGIPVVFAAGNGRASGDNVNYHNYQNDPYVITVGATGAAGVVASYSTPGAALLVSAPGTSIQTDDRAGTYGYTTNDYALMSGTSFAAPTVTGIIALMLQANPDLGYRDIMEILAYSAKNTDTTSTGWQTNGAHDWNGGGLHFSNDYGFGLVDATAAVRLAESWMKQSTYADMSIQTVNHTDNAKIPDGTGSLSSTITLNSSEIVDKVVVDLNITHANASDLTVTLTSASGTTATLISHPSNGTGGGIVFETTANTFWGEDAKGSWTLTVTDSVSGNTGTLNGWSLQVLGDAPNTPTSYIYTDEFATAAGASRALLHDTSGTGVLNTAAVTTGSYLDLHSGATDTIAGRQLQIAADTVIKFVWAGDGNDTIIANDFGDTIQAGRGNDTIVAGRGADVLYGGPGSDTFVFKFLASSVDVVRDFTAGQDVIDLNQALTSAGYSGANPIADGWLSLVSDGSGGTNIVVDAHNGQASVTVADVVGVASTLLHTGTAWTLVA
ncbi:S8 family serine peptidase [Bradyrhizobium stylosanthis]|uniref:Peptidase M10/serralysin-like protein n=1 Tax=Bradyrhizobium stylosanthis TaxID=1803665 RepID=A0A560DPX9_9BRAD|nr:S8 family serine peptidase [Bradyrhizobium stylosanthis]TWA99168.1 peptidase M10/serralysin-like protein [Bradyrhizobium stylosanthis]